MAHLQSLAAATLIATLPGCANQLPSKTEATPSPPMEVTPKTLDESPPPIQEKTTATPTSIEVQFEFNRARLTEDDRQKIIDATKALNPEEVRIEARSESPRFSRRVFS
jgi:hypothetical protein